jgi:hypothetical protein
MPPCEPVEYVYGRDGALTALDEFGNWWSGCSVPRAAGKAMLKNMDLNMPVACFLAPPHSAQLRLALDKLMSEQAIIAILPEESDARLLLACEDFSHDISAHRLWIALGTSWAEILEKLLTEQIGLAVPGQFLRLLSSNETLIQELIHEATGVFSRITVERSNRIGQMLAQFGSRRQESKLCVVTPLQFGLWKDEGRALAKAAPAGSVLIDTSDPALSSPLKLATVACECGSLITPNFARADMSGLLPMNVPWLTWITNDRIPRIDLAGPHDRLLIAAPTARAAAIAAGWPAERVHMAAWPQMNLPATKGKLELTLLADTVAVTTPDDLESFSSHRVLWETIVRELAKDPFVLDGDPGSYLLSRMRKFDVAADSFPQERFLTKLIVPAYQQGAMRALLGAGLPVRLIGEGWREIAEFESHAAGALRSVNEVEAALANSAILIDLWHWRAGHPISAVNRPILRREGRSLMTFIQRARKLLGGAAQISSPGPQVLSAEMLASLLA